MISSAVVQLGTDPVALPLGGAYGFALARAAGDTAQTFPVAVDVVTAAGSRSMLVREGVWYALGTAARTAIARLPAGSPVAAYQVDTATAKDAAAVPVAPPAAQPAPMKTERVATVLGGPTHDLAVTPLMLDMRRPAGARQMLLCAVARDTANGFLVGSVEPSGFWSEDFGDGSLQETRAAGGSGRVALGAMWANGGKVNVIWARGFARAPTQVWGKTATWDDPRPPAPRMQIWCDYGKCLKAGQYWDFNVTWW